MVSLRFSNVCDPVFQSELLLDPAALCRARQRQAAQLLDDLRGKALPITRGHAVTASERRVRR